MPRHSVRQQIVDAALAQFMEHGFTASGVKDITDAARVPKGSFYNHFESKEALAVEVLRRYEADCAIESLADVRVPPLRRLRSFFETLAGGLGRYDYARGCLFGTFGSEMSDHSEALRTQVDDSLARWSRAVAAPLREAVEQGELPAKHDPELLGRFIIDSWQGAVIRAKVRQDGQPLTDFFDVVFGVVLAA